MFTNSRRILIAAIFLLALASVASAQRNPTMAGQINDNEREELYARFAENKKIAIAERQRVAYETAVEYVKRFSQYSDAHLTEVRRFVTEYERVRGNFELHEAYVAKKYAKVFELGNAALKKDAENFYALAVLTQAGYDNAQSGDVSLNEETIGYAKSAIAIADKGSLSRTDPFANIEDARGFLNFALGWFARFLSIKPGWQAAWRRRSRASRMCIFDLAIPCDSMRPSSDCR